jgi:hypothetical protein
MYHFKVEIAYLPFVQKFELKVKRPFTVGIYENEMTQSREIISTQIN